MIEERVLKDLCITCNNSNICIKQESHKQPVYFCGNFDDFIQLPLQTGKLTGNEQADNLMYKDTSRGLCINCAVDPECHLNSGKNTVLFCEEHR